MQCYRRYKVVSPEEIRNQHLTMEEVWDLEHDEYGHLLEEDDSEDSEEGQDVDGDTEDPKEEDPNRPMTIGEWFD